MTTKELSRRQARYRKYEQTKATREAKKSIQIPRQDQVGNTTPLPEDIPLPDTPPNDGQVPIVPEPSPRRVSPNLIVAAPTFVPTRHPTRPVPFKAMGPEDTKNAHIKKLKEELKQRAWMEKSGKPDVV